MRKAGNRLRISAQLIDAESGAHLWADRYDGALEDVFDLQDQITDKVVGIVEPNLQRSEIEPARRKPPEDLGAYDLYLRALFVISTSKLSDARIAAPLLEEALKLDPNYATAHALAALCRQIFYIQGELKETDKAEGLRHARAALANAGDDATAIARAALVIGHLGWDHRTAIDAVKNALAINPSSASAHFFAAPIYAFSGDYAQAITYADRALRLSPRDSLAFLAYHAYGAEALHEGGYDAAIPWFAKSVQVTGGAYHSVFAQAASLALAGRADEGRALLREAKSDVPADWIKRISQTGMSREILDIVAKGASLLGLG